MIVVFHEVYIFATFVWGKLSNVFRSTEEGTKTNINDSRPSHSGTSSNGKNHHSIFESSPDIVSGEEHVKTFGGTKTDNEDIVGFEEKGIEHVEQLKEGAGDVSSGLQLSPIIHQIDLESREDCNKLIYDVEPTYDCVEKGMKFIPPVYVQRYMTIQSILKEDQWTQSIKKVVDFGCAELSFVTLYLKKLFGIEEILAVDVDWMLLDLHKQRVRPTPTNYLEPRPSPLTIKVFCGSVGNTNEVLQNTDAVIAIELIEHLYPNDLERLPFTVFGFIKPKLAIFTTPNSDFNVLFNLSGFRHDDHKFEWTREQFEDWGNNLVQRYPDYKVSFQGIGPGPPGTDGLGCCSQMATFIKTSDYYITADEELHVQDGGYTLLEECVYPFFEDKRTKEEKIKDSAVNFLQRCVLLRNLYGDDNEDPNNDIISLNAVMQRIKCHDRERLRKVLLDEKWEVKTNSEGHEVVILPPRENEEGYSSSEVESNASAGDGVENKSADHNKTLVNEEENWDCNENTNPNEFCNSTIASGCTCEASKSLLGSKDCVREEQQLGAQSSLITCSCSTPDKSISNRCSFNQIPVPETSCETDSCNSSFKNELVDTDLESSIYKTPYNNGYKPVNSYLNTSLYATPCCSVTQKTKIPKCLSLQQISTQTSALQSEGDAMSKDDSLTWETIDQLSKSVEGLKNQDSSDMFESCSNGSKVVDSGYCQDSYSYLDMDLVMTPEQIEDIETESEGNDSYSLPSPQAPPPQIPIGLPMVVDDVRNGDVVNNNRDGEGNNVVVDMEEEPLDFEAHIEVVGDAQNFAAVEKVDQDESLDEEICEQNEELDRELRCKSFKENTLTNKIETKSNGSTTVSDDHNVQLPDNSSVTSKHSSHSEVLANRTTCESQKGVSTIFTTPDLKSHSSLTTVLDGCSKFSNCSLVQPTERTSLDSGCDTEQINRKINFLERSKEIKGNSTHSIESYKCSVHLPNETLLENDQNAFPAWLLDIELISTDSNSSSNGSSLTILDESSSHEDDETGLYFDVPVDSRGGGDPLRDTWL